MACVLACKMRQSSRGTDVIYVEEVGLGHWAPTICMHCEKAACLEVCPSEAITRTADGIVKSADESRCVACSNCVLACPFGVPRLDESGRIMVKCDLCIERIRLNLPPYCAVVCPTGAILYEEPEEVSLKSRVKTVETAFRATPLGQLTE